MTSQRVERTRIRTGGYRRFRGEWVNYSLHCLSVLCSCTFRSATFLHRTQISHCLPWVPEVFSRVRRGASFFSAAGRRHERRSASHFLRLDRDRKPRMKSLWHPGYILSYSTLKNEIARSCVKPHRLPNISPLFFNHQISKLLLWCGLMNWITEHLKTLWDLRWKKEHTLMAHSKVKNTWK